VDLQFLVNGRRRSPTAHFSSRFGKASGELRPRNSPTSPVPTTSASENNPFVPFLTSGALAMELQPPPPSSPKDKGAGEEKKAFPEGRPCAVCKVKMKKNLYIFSCVLTVPTKLDRSCRL
jgi:hypothetical protein